MQMVAVEVPVLLDRTDQAQLAALAALDWRTRLPLVLRSLTQAVGVGTPLVLLVLVALAVVVREARPSVLPVQRIRAVERVEAPTPLQPGAVRLA